MRALVGGIALVVAGCNSLLGITDPTSTVDAPPGNLVAITIAPDPLDLARGATRQLSVIGQYDAGGMLDITGQATFSLVSGTAITVTETGLVTAVMEGPVEIGASVESFTDTIATVVGPPGPDHLLINQTGLVLRRQQQVQLRAVIVFSDGTTQEDPNITWSTSDEGIARVEAGLVTAQLASGAALITARRDGLPDATITVTVVDAVCHPVINEIQAGSSSASNEWVEIVNPCSIPHTVDGWTLNYRAATDVDSGDTNGLIDLAGTIEPGRMRLYGGDSVPFVLDDTWGNGVMQANNGAVALRSGPTSTGPLVDAMAYGTIMPGHPFIEANPAQGLVNGSSLQRLPFDGADTNDGAVDFVITSLPTPGMPNVPEGGR